MMNIFTVPSSCLVEANQLAQLGGFMRGYENMRHPVVSVHQKGVFGVEIREHFDDD